jgi:hypothetical protein
MITAVSISSFTNPSTAVPKVLPRRALSRAQCNEGNEAFIHGALRAIVTVAGARGGRSFHIATSSGGT